MLEIRHIRKLKINPVRLDRHGDIPPPRHVCNPLIGQYSTVSDAVLSSVLDLPVDKFKAQVAEARRRGVSYVHTTEDGSEIGISAVTSRVPSGSPLNKHAIIPVELMKIDPKLKDHFIITSFIRQGYVLDDHLLDWENRVDIIGWTDMDTAIWRGRERPKSFKSKLDVLTVPCRELYPITMLGDAIGAPIKLQE